MNTYALSHSGVKGMRWGIQNGPPYPLSRRSDGSLNRQKQDDRKRTAIGNMPQDALEKLKKQATANADEHTMKLINSVKESTEKTLEKAKKAKEKFDERSRENIGETIKKEFDAAKTARAERREQKEREKEAARETQKRLAEEKARAAAEDEKEALRQYIRHNPTSIYKYADAFSDEEMNDLIQRVDMDRKIKDVRDQELYRYKRYLETGVSTLQTLATGAKQTVDLYNSCASVWNSVGEYSQNKARAEGKDIKKPFTPIPVIKKGDGQQKEGQQFKAKNKENQADGNNDNQDGGNKNQKKTTRDIPGFVDNDAAEQKAREKKDKRKQEKQSDKNQNSSEKAVTKETGANESSNDWYKPVSEAQDLKNASNGSNTKKSSSQKDKKNSSSAKEKDVKYVDKVEEKNGTRYFYDKDEADAYYDRQDAKSSSKAIGSSSNLSTYYKNRGVTQRSNLESAFRKASSSDLDKFMDDLEDVKNDRIWNGTWTNRDQFNFETVLNTYIDYQSRNLKHSDMDDDPKYGLPEQKKYPMPDEKHVLSAIRFFNYVDPKDEEKLAKAILARIEEYGMDFDDFGVGEENRFRKYVPEDYLAHHGILGMKWGVRRFQNEDGTLTPAGRERYHRMIAENVVKDKVRQQKAVNGQAGLGYKLSNRNRNKVYRKVQDEFYDTPEGERLKQANKKLAKISKRTANRDATLEDQSLLGKGVNRLGQNIDNRRAVEALAEQNEAQKAGAKVYEQIREKYKDEILDASIKDLKIWEIDDGREFLEKYLRGDEDATFGPRDKKQERLEAKQVREARKAAKLEEQKETFKELYGDDYDQGDEDKKAPYEKSKYIEKVKDGDDTRYFYDNDELKAYLDKDNYSKNDYGTYEKSLKEPNRNIKQADISADVDSHFGEPLSNEQYKTLLKDIEKNYNTIQKNLTKAMVDKLAENDEYKTWKSYDGKRSLEDQKKIFLNNIGTQYYNGKNHPGYSYIRVMGDGYGVFSIDDGGEYGGHFLETEIDWKDGWKNPKVKWVSVNG